MWGEPAGACRVRRRSANCLTNPRSPWVVEPKRNNWSLLTMSRYVTELVGTFFLVFTIGLTVMNGTPMAPIAIGAALMAMVYMGGPISGAHYNPAVSVAILIRGKMEARDLIPYVTAQISGAVLASLAVMVIVGDTFAPAPASEAGLVVVLLSEALFTFALSLVVLNVATVDATADNSYYGLAIGFIVVAGTFAVGGISGGVSIRPSERDRSSSTSSRAMGSSTTFGSIGPVPSSGG